MAAASASVQSSSGEPVWYFAIGALMNPVLLSFRGITPSTASEAAELKGFSLIFAGAGAVACVAQSGAASAGMSVHGVLHQLTAAQMATLDAVEAKCKRVEVTVTRYDGTQQSAYFHDARPPKPGASGGAGGAAPDGRPFSPPRYPENDADSGAAPAPAAASVAPSAPSSSAVYVSPFYPSQRYVDILIRAARYYRIKPSYIDNILCRVRVMPRRAVNEWRKLPPPPAPIQSFTRASLATADGMDGRPLRVSVFRSVLEFDAGAVPSVAAARHLEFCRYRSLLSGVRLESILLTQLYDPVIAGTTGAVLKSVPDFADGMRAGLTLPSARVRDMTPTERAYVEDLVCAWAGKGVWRVVGVIASNESEDDDTPTSGSTAAAAAAKK